MLFDNLIPNLQAQPAVFWYIYKELTVPFGPGSCMRAAYLLELGRATAQSATLVPLLIHQSLTTFWSLTFNTVDNDTF